VAETGLKTTRDQLERALDRDREELRRALERLKAVAAERLEVARLGPRIAAQPLPWLLGGFALGVWLGWGPSREGT
jgi:hypothetical protein